MLHEPGFFCTCFMLNRAEWLMLLNLYYVIVCMSISELLGALKLKLFKIRMVSYIYVQLISLFLASKTKKGKSEDLYNAAMEYIFVGY